MSSELPFVTIVIPTRPGQEIIPAVTAARALDYPQERMELLVTRGRQPAVQRNTALREAKGELIYFLDDDTEPAPDNLRRAVEHFARDDVQVVGGPAVCPANAPFLEQVFAVVLSSWLAFGPSRARYTPVGQARASSEKELILCNLAAKRPALQQLGGFDESLYPNEENALMDDLQNAGGRLIYDPQFTAFRRPRPTLGAFFRMLMTYGRGRAEQFRLHPTLGSALNFVPPLFLLYLVLLPLANAAVVNGWLTTPLPPRWVWLGLNAPLLGYLLALAAQAIASARQFGLGRAVTAIPLVLGAHLLYGLGFWLGCFTRLMPSGARPATPVTLDRMPLRT